MIVKSCLQWLGGCMPAHLIMLPVWCMMHTAAIMACACVGGVGVVGVGEVGAVMLAMLDVVFVGSGAVVGVWVVCGVGAPGIWTAAIPLMVCPWLVGPSAMRIMLLPLWNPQILLVVVGGVMMGSVRFVVSVMMSASVAWMVTVGVALVCWFGKLSVLFWFGWFWCHICWLCCLSAG